MTAIQPRSHGEPPWMDAVNCLQRDARASTFEQMKLQGYDSARAFTQRIDTMIAAQNGGDISESPGPTEVRAGGGQSFCRLFHDLNFPDPEGFAARIRRPKFWPYDALAL